MRVSVIGGSSVEEEIARRAETLGQKLGENGHDVVCGGLGGVMAAVCRGMAKTDGLSVGILPGEDPAAANRFVDVPIATGMGPARNVLVVRNGEATIAVDGATGTLSEIAHALDMGRPVAGLETHHVPGVQAVETPAEAIEYVEEATT